MLDLRLVSRGVSMGGRTLIRGGWVVGYEHGGHTLIPNGVVVTEQDRVLQVGAGFDGRVDRTIDATGKLVVPGFIDTHVHAGHKANQRLIGDHGRREFYGQPFMEFTVPRKGTRVGGDPRYMTAEGAEAARRLLADYTVIELLRNGVTTFVEMGSPVDVQRVMASTVDRVGTRAYLGPGFDSGRWAAVDGKPVRQINEEAGRAAFDAACAYIREIEAVSDSRVHAVLAPREVETCSLDLLRATRQAADELPVPIVTHAAYSVLEFIDLMDEHAKTAVEILDDVGLLEPRLVIGHANLPAEGYGFFSGGRDVELMGQRGVSISHCPINIVRRARSLDSWKRYREAGINVALGSDTYPRDMIMQMRAASYMGKLTSHDLGAASAAEVFTAATLGGAKALGRDDLGRLAPGAKADIVIIDLSGRDTLRYGPIWDPIKSLVECGIGDDVETVIVDGRVVMEGRQIPGFDIEDLQGRAQAAGEASWSTIQEWDPLGRTAEQMSPLSFPMQG
jgi:cytosine/adenosine deaminase-related metal-dependent hydrolase